MQAATSLFDLAAQRLSWTTQRQSILAQNVANADTPGFVPRDIAPFQRLLTSASPPLARTNAAHQSGNGDLALPPTENAPPSRSPDGNAVSSPDGNAVSVELELTKIADTQSAQALTSNLVQRYMSMFRTTLGR